MTFTGGAGSSGAELENRLGGVITNSGIMTFISGAGAASGELQNLGEVFNSGTITGTTTGNPIQEVSTVTDDKTSGSTAHEPPTIGKNLRGNHQI